MSATVTAPDTYTPTENGPGSDEPPHFCALPPVPERTFGPEVSAFRARLIVALDRKWVNGTKLRYYFFDEAPYRGKPEEEDLVREGFGIWKDVGIGLEFEEIEDMDEAEIRIGFLRGDGAWSYVGRDVIDIPGQGERTMNFGWDLTRDRRAVDTPIHEIGHTLGFPHEHQNPFSGIVWNEDAVYDYFGGPPNHWPRSTTFHNVLRKLSAGDVRGSEWDADSIMHYAFTAGLIDRPEEFRAGIRPAGGLSARDTDQVRTLYPPLEEEHPLLEPFRSHTLELEPGEQADFRVEPDATRSYTIQTFGSTDTVMVLFEDQDGDLKYMSGDDDSGLDTNARIRVRLYNGRRYVLRVRHYFSWGSGPTAVMAW